MTGDERMGEVPDDVVARAVDALDDRFYVLDAEGRVVHVNESAAAPCDRSPAALRGEDVAACFPDPAAERVAAALSAARESGAGDAELDLSTPGDGTSTHEFRVRRLDDPEAGFVGVARDVSERAERERLLTDLHRATRELLAAESTDVAAEIAVETLSDQLSLSHAGIHLLDGHEDALVPVAWTDRVEATIGEPPDLGRESLAWTAFESGETAHYDDLSTAGTLHDPDTDLRSELIVPLGDHGVAIVASTEPEAFDEEDRRLAEVFCANLTAALDRIVHADRLRRRERELERENDRLDEFASVVSHDLRNPLNVAQGHVELLRDECDSDHVAPVERALDRMAELIDDVLTLAREGRTVDDIEAVDLAGVVERARANVLADAPATVRVADDATVYADESRLTQVFENFLRNAVEHGAADGPVTVTVGTLPDGFYVEDDGPGIPPEERERVLEPGYSTTEAGTGFGLSIVRDIVEAHGWGLSLTEGTDGGARFEVTGVTVE
ncbi:MAG: PAS domain-containing sensor histidine kinase [Haloferacaceae archaeon]